MNNVFSVLRSWWLICPWGDISFWGAVRSRFKQKLKPLSASESLFPLQQLHTSFFKTQIPSVVLPWGTLCGFIIFSSLYWREMALLSLLPDQCHWVPLYCTGGFPLFLITHILLQVSLIYCSIHYQLPSFVMPKPASTSLSGVQLSFPIYSTAPSAFLQNP